MSNITPSYSFNMMECIGNKRDTDKKKEMYTLDCKATGRYFIVQQPREEKRNLEEFLQLAEVEVYVGNVSRFSYNNSIRQSMN